MTGGKVGLIAGAGRFPVLFAREAKRMGVAVVALGIKGVTPDELAGEVAEFHNFPLGKLDEPIRLLKAAGVDKVVMAGKVPHVRVFSGFTPDWRAVKVLARLRDRRADTILGEVAAELRKDGIELISSATYLSHLIPEAGALTKRRPTSQDKKDIEMGWRVAKAVAAHDVGMTVVVKNGAVLAVEAMEGTDACILRAHEIAAQAAEGPLDLVVVKVAKPRQDFRFDLPVFGLDSLTTFQASGVRTVALEAGRSLLLDREHFIRRADELGLSIVAVSEENPS